MMARNGEQRGAKPVTMRSAFTVIIILATIGFVVLKAATDYADLPAHARYARAVGIALVPWVLGLVVAGIKAVVTTTGRTPGRFRESVEGAAFVMLLILYAISLLMPAER